MQHIELFRLELLAINVTTNKEATSQSALYQESTANFQDFINPSNADLSGDDPYC